jgi:hypothetical protein
MTWVVLVAITAFLVVAVVVRSGVLYRSERFLRWRRAKSRRDRGTVRAGGPSDGGGSDPTSGW